MTWADPVSSMMILNPGLIAGAPNPTCLQEVGDNSNIVSQIQERAVLLGVS
jgi:hypothetical protein